MYSDDYKLSTQRAGGEAVWSFFAELADKGYIEANSAAKVDDDYIVDWCTGKLAVAGFFEGWNTHYFKTFTEQGMIDGAFNYKFIRFPNNAPACTSYAGIIANKDTEYADEVNLFLQAYTRTARFEQLAISGAGIPFKPVTVVLDNPRLNEIVGIASGGTYDLGHSNPWFSEVRAQGFPILQQVLNGELTGAEAATVYSDAVDAIIGR